MKARSMQDHISNPETAGWLAAILSWVASLLAKLLPPALGVAVMAVVDKPDTNRELMLRLFVALACSFMFGDLVFDYLRSNYDTFKFLELGNRRHTFAVEAFVGGVAYSGLAVFAKYLRKLRADPLAAVEEMKKAAP